MAAAGLTALRRRAVRLLLAAAPVLAIAACGGGDGLDPADAPPLEDVVALMRQAGGADTISATVITWTDDERAARAFQRDPRILNTPLAVEAPDPSCGGATPRTDENRTRLLVDRPDRILVESRFRDGFRYAIARDGVREQVLFEKDLLTRPDEHRQGDVLAEAASARDLLEPAAIVEGVDLEVLGVERMETGPAAVLRGEARSDPETGAPPLGGMGEDELRLWIDLDTGVVLQVEALFDGEPFQRTTLEGLVLDEPVPAKRFRLDPPAGVRRLTMADVTPHSTTLQQAADAVPFTLFARPDVGAVQLQRAEFGAAGPVVTFVSETNGVTVEQRQADAKAQCQAAASASAHLPRGDVDVLVLGGSPDEAQVVATRDGTAITARGRRPAEALADLVASLKPVRR
jgi:hypothetical protein